MPSWSAGDSTGLPVSSSKLPFIRYFTHLSPAVRRVRIYRIIGQMDISIRSPWLGSFISLSIKLKFSLWSLLFLLDDSRAPPLLPRHSLLLGVRLILNNDITSVDSVLLGVTVWRQSKKTHIYLDDESVHIWAHDSWRPVPDVCAVVVSVWQSTKDYVLGSSCSSLTLRACR